MAGSEARKSIGVWHVSQIRIGRILFASSRGIGAPLAGRHADLARTSDHPGNYGRESFENYAVIFALKS